MKKTILFLLLMPLSFSLFSQSIGIRAGLNYSTFSGPQEAGEKLQFTDGFHFGFNYGYKFTNKFMVRAELVYTQVGAKKTYSGPGYYKIYPNNGDPTIYDKGQVDLTLEISNAYINFPVVAAYQLSPKFEVFGGASINFLVNPIGRGNFRFESYSDPDCILFRQSLDYKYFQDEAMGGRFTNTNIAICVNDERIDLPRFAGAYYQYSEVQKTGSLFKWFDASLTGGVNYFINKGFFLGVSANFGLLDITNDAMDVSLQDLEPDNKFIYRKDKDVNLSGQFSIGFRF